MISPQASSTSPPSPDAPRRTLPPPHLPIRYIRHIVPPEHLAPETRRRVARQSVVLGGVMVHMAEALGVALPEDLEWPRVIAPGWWWEPQILGHCSPVAQVTLPACGIVGADLDFQRGDPDFRLCGFAPQAVATLAFHEIAHALHFIRLGAERTAAMLAEAKGDDAALDGWPSFCGEASLVLFGRDLPDGYNSTRWPLRAPGSLPFVDALAGLLARHAVAPVEEAEAVANMARAERAFVLECQLRQAVDRMLARHGGALAA
jgi:hypothetical protein